MAVACHLPDAGKIRKRRFPQESRPLAAMGQATPARQRTLGFRNVTGPKTGDRSARLSRERQNAWVQVRLRVGVGGGASAPAEADPPRAFTADAGVPNPNPAASHRPCGEGRIRNWPRPRRCLRASFPHQRHRRPGDALGLLLVRPCAGVGKEPALKQIRDLPVDDLPVLLSELPHLPKSTSGGSTGLAGVVKVPS